MNRKEKERRVAPEIRRLDHMLARNMEAQAKEFCEDEVTMMHSWIIRYLYEQQEKEVYQKDIEKRFGIGRSSVTNIIQLMEKKGYLQREAVTHDARLKKLVLTEKGIKHHNRMENLVDHISVETAKGITDEELDVFFRVMNKLEDNIVQQKKKLQRKEEQNASDNS